MCGIIGACGAFPINEYEMLDAMRHRGPDDSGVYQNSTTFLGHLRLSIQDLSPQGHQPMVSDDKRYILVYNGEIYNHFELRKKLRKPADQFKSTSDTETLLYGLIEKGAGFIELLNGIFAFCFYDSLTNEFIVGRDQFGVKPFYYFYDGSAFAFASELKAILPFLESHTIDPDRIKDYLSFLWCPGEGTPIKEVKKLLPGHYMTLSLDVKTRTVLCESTRYYKIPFNGAYLKSNEEELVNRLDDYLTFAIKRQLLSDVPVGFFLSGGLDSSLLVAIAKRMTPNKKLQCFTIDTDVGETIEGFENDLYYAKRVARHLDVDLEIVKSDFSIVRDFDHMIWHLDEPQADAAPLNVANISKRAREMGYKVLIGGTAGDDLFSGYRRHQAIQLEKIFDLFPSVLLKWLSRARVPIKGSFSRRVNKVVRELGKDKVHRLANYFVWLPPDRVNRLLALPNKGTANYDSTSYLLNLLEEIPCESSWLNRMLYWELRSFLVDHNLNYTDKMGMAHGVEIRVPYLDLDLVGFSTQIPPQFKLKHGQTKYLLKKVAERYLPKEVIYRSKTGFGAPVRKWILNDLNELIEQRLLVPSAFNSLFNIKEVEKLVRENKAGVIDASYSIWGLLALESWICQFTFGERRTD